VYTYSSTVYAIRIHDRITDDDPDLATVMYARDCEGPWYDMATGVRDFAEEIADALTIVEEQRIERVRVEQERLRREVAMGEMVSAAEDAGHYDEFVREIDETHRG
jgi:hypothetical protein